MEEASSSLLPPGFRFHPTDEELVTYYLTRKATEFGFVTRAIADVDLTKCEPWDLPGKASMGEKEWYFFSMKDRKYPTGLRTNRATEAGYWKTTGKDKEIFHFGVLVGMKKTLVFYKGRAPRGEKTSWVMHEYRLLQTTFSHKPSKEEWIVCRVFKKIPVNVKKAESGDHSLAMPPAVLLGSPCDNATSLSELAELDVSALGNLVVNSSPSACVYSSNEGSSGNNSKMEMMNSPCWSWVPPLSLESSGLMAPTPAILKALAIIHDGVSAGASNLSYSLAGGGDRNVLLQSMLNPEQPIWRGY